MRMPTRFDLSIDAAGPELDWPDPSGAFMCRSDRWVVGSLESAIISSKQAAAAQARRNTKPPTKATVTTPDGINQSNRTRQLACFFLFRPTFPFLVPACPHPSTHTSRADEAGRHPRRRAHRHRAHQQLPTAHRPSSRGSSNNAHADHGFGVASTVTGRSTE